MQVKPRKFNMPVLRRRAKKMMRSKYKKTIKLSDLDKIWKEYVEYGIIKPLLHLGKVQVDSKLSIEIVGTKITQDAKAFSLLVGGRNITKAGKIKKAVKFDGRPGVKYKVVLEDKNYKGNLIFRADTKLSHRVYEELKNTNTYYRIKNVGK
jgi:hypothetical protein